MSHVEREWSDRIVLNDEVIWDDEWDDDDYDFDLPDDEDGYVDRTVPICDDCGEHDWPWAGCACDDDEKWGVPCCTTLASVGTCSCPDREQNVGY